MVDIFVVTILVALVRLGNLATIEAGAAPIFFGAVVVITMLAAESFDPRLIWDRIERGDMTNTTESEPGGVADAVVETAQATLDRLADPADRGAGGRLRRLPRPLGAGAGDHHRASRRPRDSRPARPRSSTRTSRSAWSRTVRLAPDLSGVVCQARMVNGAEEYLTREDAVLGRRAAHRRRPGHGAHDAALRCLHRHRSGARGQAHPRASSASTSAADRHHRGARPLLRAALDGAGAVGVGSPVFFRRIEVGQVVSSAARRRRTTS